jgi:hypothetical protein
MRTHRFSDGVGVMSFGPISIQLYTNSTTRHALC